MPHLQGGIEARIGDRVIDSGTKVQGTILRMDEGSCRITVDFGKFRLTGPAGLFEKAA